MSGARVIVGLDDAPRVEVTSRASWRRWLSRHHDRSDGIWVVTYKKHVKDKHVPWPDVVKEALCFGWIDSRTRRVDDDRTSVFVTRRKKGSYWSATNKAHIAELEAAGLIAPQGQAVLDQARKDGSWTFLDDVEALVEPEDLCAALDTSKAARAHWDDHDNASTKKRALYHIKLAKTDTTRQARIASIVERCRGEQQPV